MTRFYFIFIACTIYLNSFSQEIQKQELPVLSLDDNADGYTILNYKIPADGYYIFSVVGGLIPQNDATIYYCAYIFQLRSNIRSYSQETVNIGTQAQDGNMCYFNTNEKDNHVTGVFTKNEIVEFRIILQKTEVNGTPHKPMQIIPKSLISVKQVAPDYLLTAE